LIAHHRDIRLDVVILFINAFERLQNKFGWCDQPRMYLFGGFTYAGTGGVFTDTWRFDPAMPSGSRWTQIANLNLGRAFIASAVQIAPKSPSRSSPSSCPDSGWR